MKLLYGGEELDAEFDITGAGRDYEIFLKSAGGGRNRAYKSAQLLLLKRCGELQGRLTDAWLKSTSEQASRLSREELKIALEYSVRLSEVDHADLVAKIRKSVRNMAREVDAGGSGNPEKSISLSIKFPEEIGIGDLASYIREGSLDDEQELDQFISGADESSRDQAQATLDRLQLALERYNTVSPDAKERLSTRIERGPVGQIMKGLIGHRCQIGDALNIECETFIGKDERPFVEAHHVVLVSTLQPGVLRAANVVILCPHHHREVHHGLNAYMSDDGHQFRFRVSSGGGIVDKPNIADLLFKAHGKLG